jgi:preprotein translocase subunit SecB
MTEKNSIDPQPGSNATSEPKPLALTLQRIYTKDLSFESPKSPSIFSHEWKPSIELALKTNTQHLADDVHEVVLQVTVTAKLENEVAFLIEVQQAGVFGLQNFPPERLQHMLGSYCPNILFPYVRELVSDLVLRGNFPPMALVPIDFDALYARHLKQQADAAQAPTEAQAE